MVIKINEESFNIEACTEKVTMNNHTLHFSILGDYSATFILDLIKKDANTVYTLIDDNGKERKFLGYTEIKNIESYYGSNLNETTTSVTLEK